MNEPIHAQQAYWTKWNAENREKRLSDISRDQQDMVIAWLGQLGRTDLDIIEVGCGAGWLCPALLQYGKVTATDFAEEVVARAQQRVPDAKFVAGDFMALDFGVKSYDVVVTLEVLSHVSDQEAFVAKLASLLKPGGWLILATQNRPVLENHNHVMPTQPGQLRHWLDRAELEALLSRHLQVQKIETITPTASKGVMRLLAGRAAKRVWRAIFGTILERRLAAAGFGWTLMALAQKPAG
jgi:2-polyprenyl-3-methyl-5-hydroxy-6-metoxy-1,4-benzoquinol methylase